MASLSRLPMLVLICCNSAFYYSWGRICFIFLLLVGEGFGAVNVTKGFGAINVTNTNCGCTILIITVLKNINEEYLQTNIFLFVFTI